MSEIERNKRVAIRYLELVSSGDADAMVALCTEDCKIIVESSTLLPPMMEGREQVRELIAMLPALFPETGLKIIIDDVTAEDDRVAIRAHSDAIHVSGKPYSNRYHFLIRVRDGQVYASHEYLDSLLLTDVFFDGARP